MEVAKLLGWAYTRSANQARQENFIFQLRDSPTLARGAHKRIHLGIETPKDTGGFEFKFAEKFLSANEDYDHIRVGYQNMRGIN
jgi:hypothetical protein